MTHINAFYGEVEEAKKAVDESKSHLEEAQRRLESHPDYKAPKKVKSEKKEASEKNQTKKAPKKSK